MYVHARVRAGAKKEEVEEAGDGRLRIAVREPAKQNLANRRVVELVARHYRVAPGKVRLVSGHHSPSKILSVDIGI
jgi:uncharacterized protein YggU (UPF0235/DUF167 family)